MFGAIPKCWQGICVGIITPFNLSEQRASATASFSIAYTKYNVQHLYTYLSPKPSP